MSTGNRYNWTEEILKELIEGYGPYGWVPKFSKRVGIPVSAIYKRAECLGLKKKPKGWYIMTTGYMWIDRVGNNKGILAHRKIMEDYLGRELTSKDIVHHINGDKLDNRIENLVLTTRAAHIEIHRKELKA